MLAYGKIAAAILPEPFASQAEQQYGAVPLADLNQGATTDFPIEGYVVTKQWAAQNPNTLKRFLAALEIGQEISDTDRAAVEQAFEAINGPQNGQVTPAHRGRDGARQLPDRHRRDPDPARRGRYVPVRRAEDAVQRVEHADAVVVLQLRPVLFVGS